MSSSHDLITISDTTRVVLEAPFCRRWGPYGAFTSFLKPVMKLSRLPQAFEDGFDLVRRVNTGAARTLKGGDDGKTSYSIFSVICFQQMLRREPAVACRILNAVGIISELY